MIRWFAFASVLIAAFGAFVIWLAATDELDEKLDQPFEVAIEDTSPTFV